MKFFWSITGIVMQFIAGAILLQALGWRVFLAVGILLLGQAIYATANPNSQISRLMSDANNV